MKYEHGTWRVIRDCCTSGNCAYCEGARRGKGVVRIIQSTGYSEAYAKHVAGNWAQYNATVEPMPAWEIATPLPDYRDYDPMCRTSETSVDDEHPADFCARRGITLD
jgi:hypothetical protein